MSRGILFVALLVCLVPARPARAQDSNYWTNKYGTRSILLNGAVIGGPVDLSAMYYNPGGLALLKDPGTVLTVKAFAFSNISLPDAGGGTSTSMTRAPPFFRHLSAGCSTCAFWGATRWPIPSFRDRGCRPTSPGRAWGRAMSFPHPVSSRRTWRRGSSRTSMRRGVASPGRRSSPTTWGSVSVPT